MLTALRAYEQAERSLSIRVGVRVRGSHVGHVGCVWYVWVRWVMWVSCVFRGTPHP